MVSVGTVLNQMEDLMKIVFKLKTTCMEIEALMILTVISYFLLYVRLRTVSMIYFPFQIHSIHERLAIFLVKLNKL